MLKFAVVLCVAILIVAHVDSEEEQLAIVANQVTVDGRVSVSGPSQIKGIGQGVVQVTRVRAASHAHSPTLPIKVRDKDSRNTVLLGTSTAVGSGEGVRMMPVEGSGFAIAPSSEQGAVPRSAMNALRPLNMWMSGGLFVASSSGYVGVNANSQLKEQIHVSGELQTDKLVAGHSGQGIACTDSEHSLLTLLGSGPSVLLAHASEYHAVVLGKPTANGAQKYSLGRGTTAQRAMTFHAAGIDEYDGSGKPPLMVYMSPEKVLIAVNADTGNTYVSGTVAISAQTDEKPPLALAPLMKKWTSGSESNLAVAGSVSMELPQGQKGGASLFYTSAGSFSIRSNTFDAATKFDTKFFISGASAKGGARVGVNTVKPKAMLDVNGHMHVASNSRGDAHLYFPQTGEQAGFYIRSSDEPKANDRDTTRFYLSADGKIGVNTLTPEAGLEIEAKSGVNSGDDIVIKKGNLRVHDGIRHTNKRHMLLMDGDNIFNGLHMEQSLTISPSGKPSAIKSNHVHVQGTDNPVVRVDTASGGSAAMVLQSGKGAWTLSHDAPEVVCQGTNCPTVNGLNLKESHGGKMPSVTVDPTGRWVVGGAIPEFGMQIETPAAVGSPENSVMIKKGNLNLFGGIYKREILNGKEMVWGLYPRGFSNLWNLGVNEKLGIGIASEPQHDFFIEKHRTVSIGESAFLGTDGEVGTLSYNEYSVLSEGLLERRIHNTEHFSAAMRVTNQGKVEFDGTAAAGALNTHKLLVLDPSTSVANFGKFLDIGFQGGTTNKVPLRVKGVAGKSKTEPGTITFGHTADARGHIGANELEVFITSQDEKKMIMVDNTDKSEEVAFGLKAQGLVQVKYGSSQDVTVITDKPDVTMSLTTEKRKGHAGNMIMRPGGDVELTTTGVSSSGAVHDHEFHVKEFKTIEFQASRCPNIADAKNVFERRVPEGKQPGEVGTHFQSGKVGIGTENPLDSIHVNGDVWFQGRFLVKKGFRDGSNGQHGDELMEELSQSLLEVGESNSELAEDEQEHDIVTILEHMSKIVRKNKSRLQKQHETILLLEQQLATTLSRV